MSRIAVVGAGYVGLVTAACFARLGNQVACIETDVHRISMLRRGELPIREPGLDDLWRGEIAAGRLRVCSSYHDVLTGVEFVFLAVGTPSRRDGRPSLRQVLSATRSVARSLNPGASPVVVVKSTVPLGTAELVARVFEEHAGHSARVVSNPEFLREGNAVFDFLRPDRVVLGSEDPDALEETAQLYRTLKRPVVRCSTRTAELIKYASNALLCTKVSFINEIALLCEQADVDVVDITRALNLDPRMGPGYLDAGLGWGGSCLPKDLRALSWMASRVGVDTQLLQSVSAVNYNQPERVSRKLVRIIGPLKGRTIGLLGLTFKPNCDDIRESPSLELARRLIQAGAIVRAYDPLGMAAAARELPELNFALDAYDAAAGSDALVVATAWPDFGNLDYESIRTTMAGSVIFDARNFLDGEAIASAGLNYLSLGHRDRPAADLEALPFPEQQTAPEVSR